MQSLGEIEQRAPAAVAKIWRLCFTGRMPQSGKLPVLVFFLQA